MYNYNFKAYPLIWVFMGDTEEESYNIVLKKIKDTFPQLQPVEILTDFKQGLATALKETFNISDNRIMGSFYNYSQVKY